MNGLCQNNLMIVSSNIFRATELYLTQNVNCFKETFGGIDIVQHCSLEILYSERYWGHKRRYTVGIIQLQL